MPAYLPETARLKADSAEREQSDILPVLRVLPPDINDRTAAILLDAAFLTYAETADRHGITSGRVSQIVSAHREAFDSLCLRRDEVVAGIASDAAAIAVHRVREWLSLAKPSSSAEAQRFVTIAAQLQLVEGRLTGREEAATRTERKILAKDAAKAAKSLQTIDISHVPQICVTSHVPHAGQDNEAKTDRPAE